MVEASNEHGEFNGVKSLIYKEGRPKRNRCDLAHVAIQHWRYMAST